MKNKFLITSPLDRTWPKNKNSELIICSESAVLNFKKLQESYKYFTINKNKWENKKKLFKDYSYLESLYEKLLRQISHKLNEHHSIEENLEFWRILIGPWLGNFTHVFFERWQNIDSCIKKSNSIENISIDFDYKDFIPYDHKEFIKYSLNDYWNQFIYQNILGNISKKKNVLKIKKNLIYKDLKKNNLALNFNEKKYSLINLIKYLFDLINKKDSKYFFYKTYLSFKDELKLNLKFNQLPRLNIKKLNIKKKNINFIFREKTKLTGFNKNKFEKLLNEILFFQIPSVYLEDFDNLTLFKKNSKLPSNPKIIFTSNAAWFDSHIAYYIAKMKSKKTKIFYGQHGGNYSISKILWPEKHEKKISDKFLSWGWKEKGSKVIPLSKFKSFNVKKTNDDELLIMLKNRQRYFCSMDSSGGTESFSSYLNYISAFLIKLNSPNRKKTILRLPNNNDIKSFDIYSKLEKRFNFRTSNSLIDAFSKSKLIVHTLISTSINDALDANLPSIIIIRKDQNPINVNATKVFKMLHDANILFYDPIKAAKFVDTIWDNNRVELWWNKKRTQDAVKIFCKYFAKDNKYLIQNLNKIFRERTNRSW